MTRRSPSPFLIGLLPALLFSGAHTSRTTAETARPKAVKPLELPITRKEISNRWKSSRR